MPGLPEGLDPVDRATADVGDTIDVAGLVAALPVKERDVVRLYYGLDGTAPRPWNRSAGGVGLSSKQRVHQLLGKALARLRKAAREP